MLSKGTNADIVRVLQAVLMRRLTGNVATAQPLSGVDACAADIYARSVYEYITALRLGFHAGP